MQNETREEYFTINDSKRLYDNLDTKLDRKYTRQQKLRISHKRYSINRDGAMSVDMVKNLQCFTKPFHESLQGVKLESNTKSVACQDDFSSSGEHCDLKDIDSDLEISTDSPQKVLYPMVVPNAR